MQQYTKSTEDIAAYREEKTVFPAEILWEILVEDVSQTWEPCRLMGLNEPNIIRRSNLQRWADRNILIPQSQMHTFYKVFNELISTNKTVLLETPETFFFFLTHLLLKYQVKKQTYQVFSRAQICTEQSCIRVTLKCNCSYGSARGRSYSKQGSSSLGQQKGQEIQMREGSCFVSLPSPTWSLDSVWCWFSSRSQGDSKGLASMM